ncbi:MAG: hypothetical protein IT324_07130, partial [Anaerolineae bacterium]|nr:hypothetical protein [Anaerolineae bacterium]
MDFTYQATGWIEEANDFDLNILESRLREYFPEASVSRDSNHISLWLNDWWLNDCIAELQVVDTPYIVEEGKEFLQQFPDCPPEIANCRKRIEIFFPDKSADMEHFNNYLF